MSDLKQRITIHLTNEEYTQFLEYQQMNTPFKSLSAFGKAAIDFYIASNQTTEPVKNIIGAQTENVIKEQIALSDTKKEQDTRIIMIALNAILRMTTHSENYTEDELKTLIENARLDVDNENGMTTSSLYKAVINENKTPLKNNVQQNINQNNNIQNSNSVTMPKRNDYQKDEINNLQHPSNDTLQPFKKEQTKYPTDKPSLFIDKNDFEKQKQQYHTDTRNESYERQIPKQSAHGPGYDEV